ncbi:DUF6879 family protein [Marinactinospora rubrisoli]|uniref:DUF6879 family protein n=1 Tax=Marinactinospora rubrisoli TaxID=2715399 RepID=A0ABW2KM29_9ACTN
MVTYIDEATFGDYFRDFQYTAWRLESRRGYASDRASEKYQRFLAGQPLPDDRHRPWRVNVREQVRQGKWFARVRILDSPPTEGQRYLLTSAASNIASGEDIRNLWRADAEKLGLPAVDFWLFDSRRALVLHFDQDDELLGSELVEDPARIVEFCQIRDAAWHHAIRRDDVLRQLPSTA